jgi:hypothetical protein
MPENNNGLGHTLRLLKLIFPPKSGHQVKIVWTDGDDGDKITPCQWEGDTQIVLGSSTRLAA